MSLRRKGLLATRVGARHDPYEPNGRRKAPNRGKPYPPLRTQQLLGTKQIRRILRKRHCSARRLIRQTPDKSLGEETGLPFYGWIGRGFVPAKTPLTGSRFEWERLNPTGFPGNVCLDNVRSGLPVSSTDLTPLH